MGDRGGPPMTAFPYFDPRKLAGRAQPEEVGAAKAAKAAKAAETQTVQAAKPLLKLAKVVADKRTLADRSKFLASPNPQKTATLASLATLAGVETSKSDFEERTLDFANPVAVRSWYDNQVTGRLDSSHYTLAEARILAYGRLVAAWMLAHRHHGDSSQCAACQKPLSGSTTMMLPDRARVCDRPDYACLIEYGTKRRQEAIRVLRRLGLQPPDGWEP